MSEHVIWMKWGFRDKHSHPDGGDCEMLNVVLPEIELGVVSLPFNYYDEFSEFAQKYQPSLTKPQILTFVSMA